VRKIIALRLTKITSYCERILTIILHSLGDILYGIRWICSQLDKLARATFLDATEEQLRSVIGGFLFLRFLNPIIVTPDGNNIITKKVDKVKRRNLTLIAKVLQNMSNGVQFAKKEAFMISLNTFLNNYRFLMDDIFEQIIQVYIFNFIFNQS